MRRDDQHGHQHPGPSRSRALPDAHAPADELARERSAREAAEARAAELEEELARSKRAEGAAREAAESAARSRDQFISTVSHDLRGPIGTVLTWAQLLRGGMLTDEKRQRALDAIERGARTQVRLLETLVDLARLRAGTLAFHESATDLTTIARSAIEKSMSAAQAKRVAIELAAAPEAMPIHADGDRLAQALAHLIDNAVRATPDGGCVDVRLRRDGATVEIAVQDTGAGIEPERAATLVEGARDVDPPLGGRRGLGLPLAIGLLDHHRAAVSITSDGPGLGTTATVRFPAGTPAAKPAAAEG
jgi:signal transduction histidine kinase